MEPFEAFRIHPKSVGNTPEESLWFAVLAQAGQDMQSNNLIDRSKAAAYFLSDDCGIGSFVWICEQLSFSVSKIRGAFKIGKERNVA